MMKKELDEALKQSLLDLAWSKKDFRDYKDVVNLDILIKAYRSRYQEKAQYLDGIKEQLIGDLPDLDRVYPVPETNVIWVTSVKVPLTRRRLFHTVLIGGARIIIENDNSMELFTPYNEHPGLDKKKFLEKHRDLLFSTIEKYRGDPFSKYYYIPTLEDKFKEAKLNDHEVYTEYSNELARRLHHGFGLHVQVRTNGVCAYSSLKRTREVFSNSNVYGRGEIQRLFDRILISESAIPPFIQEEVQKQKSKLMK